jgi:autotransporter-associated beta strand protein
LAVTTGDAMGTGTVTLSGGNLMLESDTGIALTNAVTFAANTALVVKRHTPGGGIVDSLGAASVESSTGTITVETDSTVTGSAALSFGATTLFGNATFNVGSLTSLTLGAVGESGGSFGLTKTGVGSLILAAANTYAGGTTVSAGTLAVSGGGTLGSGSALTVNGGTLDLGGTGQTVGAVSLTGGLITDGTLTGSSYTAQNGSVSAILGGGGALTENGAGTVTLSGANTYTGPTTISAGTLVLSGSTAAGSAVAVGSGGTLAGTGTVSGALAVASGGTLAPSAGPAPLTLGGNLTLNGGSTLAFGLSAAAQSQLVLHPIGTNALTGPGAGTVTINLLDLNGTVVPGTTYTLISVVASFGTVSNWTLASFTLNAPPEWAGSFLTLSGDNLDVDVIPEPAALTLFTALATCVLLVRRRRVLR